jgi:hypothetical protein
MGGWMDGSKSGFKDCLQQSKTKRKCLVFENFKIRWPTSHSKHRPAFKWSASLDSFKQNKIIFNHFYI